MKTVSITEAKNHLSALIDGLANGSPVLILDRGRPVARLEPVAGTDNESDDDRLARLERKGLIRRGRGKLPKDFFATELPQLPEGVSLVEAVLQERREGR